MWSSRSARIVCGASLLLGLTGFEAAPAQPLCVASVTAMPETWRPPADVRPRLNPAPWSDGEAAETAAAAKAGMDELVRFFANRPQAIATLGSDAVEAAIDGGYAASNTPALRREAYDLARRNLMPLIEPHLARTDAPTCKVFTTLLTLTIHAHALLPAGDARLEAMVARTNAAYRACGSLAAAMGYDYRARLAARDVSLDDVWDVAMWSITFTDAQTVPGLAFVDEVRAVPPALWQFLAHYPFKDARDYPDGARNGKFYDTAYLATHIGYIPTGYGRHPIFIADAPWLYRFLRENFYAVLDMGELDLVAEFVDLFREYGCDERNDAQTRDGTRYLMGLYRAAGNSWMAHREPDEPADTGDYNEVHKVWTGVAAVRTRVPEAPAPGTYGGIVRAWLHPQQ